MNHITADDHPYRFLKRDASGTGQSRSLFEALELPTEISTEKYQEILDSPENAGDFSAVIEIDTDENIIRAGEDMGGTKSFIYRKKLRIAVFHRVYPLPVLL